MNNRKKYHQRRLDYEIGHLVKSPCKGCLIRHRFPGCIPDCDTLDRVQTRLSRSISSTYAFSQLESYTLHLDEKSDK